MSIVWTEDRVEALKKLWEAGLSASQCAAELNGAPFTALGHVSRNAAIGKVHRMGLSGRTKGQQRSGAPRVRKARPAQTKMITVQRPTRVAAALALETGIEEDLDAEVDVVSAYDNVILMHQRLQLVDLTDAHCHWPVGDPLQEGFFFCGGRSLDGLPYCAHHTRISIQASQPTRRRPRPRV